MNLINSKIQLVIVWIPILELDLKGCMLHYTYLALVNLGSFEGEWVFWVNSGFQEILFRKNSIWEVLIFIKMKF